MKAFTKIIAMLLVFSMLALPAYADTNDFVPSVSGGKDAPAIVPIPGGDVTSSADGETGSGLPVYDQADEIVDVIPVPDVTVTPYADRNEAKADVAESLNTAYDSVADVVDLTDAMPLLPAALENTLNQMKADGLTPEDAEAERMVVRDLINVELNPIGVSILSHGETVAIHFDVEVDENKPLVLMRQVAREDLPADFEMPTRPVTGADIMDDIKSWFAGETDEGKNLIQTIFSDIRSWFTGKSTLAGDFVWLPVDPEMIERQEDGSIIARLEKLGNQIGTLAFLTPAAE